VVPFAAGGAGVLLALPVPDKNQPVRQATAAAASVERTRMDERVSVETVHHLPVGVPALVEHRIHDRPVAAVLAGNVLYSDQVYHRHAGPRRYFWLLDDDVQLVYEPFGWRNEWYVDLVSISARPVGDLPCFSVRDEYVDLVIEGMGPTYRILDLDEAGVALSEDRVGAEDLAATLAATQRFLDRHLHRGAPFPPAAILPLFSADHHYPAWSSTPVRK
jgi:predicted RNA-binding protein associated with RNAse of E/G family